MNQSVQTRRKSSKYKGVHWFKRDSIWVVQIAINGRTCHVGRFFNEEEAAEAYNQAAIEHYGQFANLNIIE